jgi:uncharacterized membrane protein required for colicin V production
MRIAAIIAIHYSPRTEKYFRTHFPADPFTNIIGAKH